MIRLCVCPFVLLYVSLCAPPSLDGIFLCPFLGEGGVRYTGFFMVCSSVLHRVLSVEIFAILPEGFC